MSKTMANDLCDFCGNSAHYSTWQNFYWGKLGSTEIKRKKIYTCQICHENAEIYTEIKIKKDPMPNKLTPSDIYALMGKNRISPICGVSHDQAKEKLVSLNLLTAGGDLTEGGRMLVEALCLTPLPVQKWVMPNE